MDEPKNQQTDRLLKRAEAQKRPSDLPNDGAAGSESVADKAGFDRPEREMQTAEKNHPETKE